MCREVLRIGSYSISGYGLFLTLAIFISYFVTEYRIKKHGLNSDLALPMYATALISGFIGAKLMYVVTVLITNRLAEIDLTQLFSGFVIYGGIIVAIPSVYILCKIRKVDVLSYMDVGIASIAIAQAVGRIGCLMAGCCYGITVSDNAWYGITFKESIYASPYIAYIPTQIIMCVLDFINFLILCTLNKLVKIKGITLYSYLVTYGIGRFAVEFIRGDTERGYIGVFSLSQIISIFMIITGAILIVITINNNKHDNDTYKKLSKHTK